MKRHDSSKARVRAAVVAARRSLPVDLRNAETAALRGHILAMTIASATVCAYVPVGSEPGSPELLDALVGAGVRVLLPVARELDGVPQPLRWGEYTSRDALVPGPFGLREPAEPRLPPETIADADTVLAPALAVDRTGTRLGRGAGYYDRTLGLAAAGARLIAVVRDVEIVDRLPAEDHDIAMTHAVAPGLGLVGFGPGMTCPT